MTSGQSFAMKATLILFVICIVLYGIKRSSLESISNRTSTVLQNYKVTHLGRLEIQDLDISSNFVNIYMFVMVCMGSLFGAIFLWLLKQPAQKISEKMKHYEEPQCRLK